MRLILVFNKSKTAKTNKTFCDISATNIVFRILQTASALSVNFFKKTASTLLAVGCMTAFQHMRCSPVVYCAPQPEIVNKAD